MLAEAVTAPLLTTRGGPPHPRIEVVSDGVD
jgi:hypothetical protein